MDNSYEFITKTYNREKSYQKDIVRMSKKGWEVVNSESIPNGRGCISTIIWVTLFIVTLGLLPLIVWALMGRRIKIIVQYQHKI
jgi:hypothetical protein